MTAAAQLDLPHGTISGYITHRCRCAACRGANRRYMANWRAKRRAAKQAAHTTTTNPPPRPDSKWRDAAACAERSDIDWFPLGGTPRYKERVQAAKAVCRACPVRAECLADALATEANEVGRWGIRGGATSTERHQMTEHTIKEGELNGAA